MATRWVAYLLLEHGVTIKYMESDDPEILATTVDRCFAKHRFVINGIYYPTHRIQQVSVEVIK